MPNVVDSAAGVAMESGRPVLIVAQSVSEYGAVALDRLARAAGPLFDRLNHLSISTWAVIVAVGVVLFAWALRGR
jgi:hypothetical protein